MPIILFVILVILIAQIGFWNTLEAILGGVLMVLLLLILAGALLFLAGRYAWGRLRR